MLVLAVEGCVLWTCQQDRELGPRASTRDRKEDGSASVSPHKQVLWLSGKGIPSCSGNRPSYSLPLAWHDINCCAPLNPFKGRHLPPLCILLLWSLLLPATWNVVWHLWLDPGSLRVTHIALNFVPLCCTKIPTFPHLQRSTVCDMLGLEVEVRGWA